MKTFIATLNTVKAVYKTFNKNTKVAPGHGPVTSIEAIKWVLDYLTTVESKVGEAISDGLSLEETIARVQMQDFQGYALFGWVHSGLNVPAAYSDLK